MKKKQSAEIDPAIDRFIDSLWAQKGLAELTLSAEDGTPTILLDANRSSVGPELAMYNSAGQETIELLAEEASGNGAQLVLRKAKCGGFINRILQQQQVV